MCSANSSREGGGPSKITSAPTCMWDASPLLVEERGIHRAETVLVRLLSHRMAEPNAPASACR